MILNEEKTVLVVQEKNEVFLMKQTNKPVSYNAQKACANLNTFFTEEIKEEDS